MLLAAQSPAVTYLMVSFAGRPPWPAWFTARTEIGTPCFLPTLIVTRVAVDVVEETPVLIPTVT